MEAGFMVALGGVAVAVVACAFSALQARAAARQVEICNDINGVTATNNVIVNLNDVLRAVLDHPELYPYFYESAPVPASGETRGKVLVLADMLCSALSAGLHAAEKMPSAENGLALWPSFAGHWLRTCPAVQQVVDANPAEWHYLAPLRQAPLAT